MENLTKMDDLGYTPILGTSVLVHTGPYLTFFTRESVKLCSAHRWLMTTAELTSYDAASYPPTVCGPQLFWGALWAAAWLGNDPAIALQNGEGKFRLHQVDWSYPLVDIAIENGHRNSGFTWIYPLKMTIFHSYVSLPEGTDQIWAGSANSQNNQLLAMAFSVFLFGCSIFAIADAPPKSSTAPWL